MRQNIVKPIYGQRFSHELKLEDEVLPILQMEESLACEVKSLLERGIRKVVLAIDEDNASIRALSPRFSDEKLQEAVAEKIVATIAELSSQFDECLVALTVEELCPGGGLDPSDGIALAQRFVAAGASAIIASGGTVDFLPLKNRRPTQQKNEADEDKSREWPEPWISSALWLVGRIHVPIYAQGPVANLELALLSAKANGLAGIIDASVIRPSAL